MARRRIMSNKWEVLYTGLPMMEDLVYYNMPDFFRYICLQNEDDVMSIDYFAELVTALRSANEL